MSFQALNWATGLVVGSSTAKFVLMALANYADEEGMCFPSVSMLMGDTELSKRAVSGAIKTLCDKGLLTTERQRNGDGSLGRNRYRLQLSRPSPLTVSADYEAADHSEPCAPDAHGEKAPNQVHLVPSPGAPHDPPGARGAPPIDEPPIEPPSEPSVERARASARTPQGAEDDQPDGSAISEARRQAEETFKKRFWPKWPGRVVDNRDRALAEFLMLSPEDLEKAIVGIVPFHEAQKRAKRTKPLAAATYLKQAKWVDLEGEPVAGERYIPPIAKPWSPLFMASLIELLRTGEARSISFDLSQARNGSGNSLRFGRKRNDELVMAAQGFERVPTHSQRWKAWRGWIERRLTDLRVGAHHLPHFRDDPVHPFWLSVPSAAMAKAWEIELELSSAEIHPPPQSISDEEAAAAFR